MDNFAQAPKEPTRYLDRVNELPSLWADRWITRRKRFHMWVNDDNKIEYADISIDAVLQRMHAEGIKEFCIIGPNCTVILTLEAVYDASVSAQASPQP